MQAQYREGVFVISRNNACAEIISRDGDRYTVRVRGSPETTDSDQNEKSDPHRFETHEGDLTFATPELPEACEQERIRKHLFELHSSVVSSEAESEGAGDGDVGKRVAGHLLGDECGFLIWKHTDFGDLGGLPKEVEERVLALLVEQNYVLGGESFVSGRSLTSYARILVPFVNVEEVKKLPRGGTKKAAVQPATPRTGEAIVSWFESLVLARTPALSAPLFFRAFAFGQWRCDNRSAASDDPLLDAFYVVFGAIQMMTGKGSSEEMRSCHMEIQRAIEIAFRRHGTEFQTTSEGKQHMRWRALLWCLCNLFIHLGFVVRDKVPHHQYQILLPNPYGDTISEQGNVANICIECRGEHPASYHAAYQMIMDVKDFILPPASTGYLSNALRIARKGKEVASKNCSPYYSLAFLLIESFWIPTSLWPSAEVVTYEDIDERFALAKMLKRTCQDYTSEKSLHHASTYKNMLKAFLKSLGVISPSEQGCFLVSSIQFDPYAY